MGKIAVVVGLSFAASFAFGDWVYEGEWGREGYGYGEFKNIRGISAAANGRVYVTGARNQYPPIYPRIQYFTPVGSFLGFWSVRYYVGDVAVGLSGWVYTVTAPYGGCVVERYTAAGSFLSRWGVAGSDPISISVSADGNVYVLADSPSCVSYHTATGSLLGSWGYKEFSDPTGIAVAPRGRVYVVERGHYRVQYFTSTGSFLGSWATRGEGVAVAPNGDVFISGDGRVRQFSATGSYIFDWPLEGALMVALSPSGERVYVTDADKERVVYFRESEPTVAPASLGKVKALFK